MDDLNDKVTGGTLTAAEWNQVPSEIQNVIEGLGITLSGGDLNQLGKGIAGYVANGTFYTDSGAADAYVLTGIGSKQALTAYTDGATFEFVAGNPNTGASTVNVAALGVKNIKLADGTDPADGQIDGRVLLKFDSANDRCELILSGFVTTSIITVSGAYTPPAGVKSLEFTAIAGGGGGGGIDGQGAGTAAVSGSGAAGSTAIKTTSSIESSYTVTIGAGGSGGTVGDNDGAVGGTTTIVSTGVNTTSLGGLGGLGGVGSSGGAGEVGRAGGTASGGDLNISGGDASGTRVLAGEIASLSVSGSSILGGGARAGVSAAGVDASVPGSGGGGTSSVNISGDNSGGDGADGIVIVKEFF